MCLSPEKLSQKHAADILQAWVADNEGLMLGSNIEEYAQNAHDVCNGHPGLTGSCCQQLLFEAESATAKGQSYSAGDFERFLSWKSSSLRAIAA